MINDAGTAAVRPLTLAWVGRHLEVGERVVGIEALHGGITAEVRRLTLGTRDGHTRDLVLRTFVHPFYVERAEDSLNREADALAALVEADVPAPELVAVDPTAAHCEFPSLLMTHLPGRTVLDDDALETRVPLLARQLVAIHALRPAERPRKYVALTTAETVVVPESAGEAPWAAAIDMIRRPAPPYRGRFLHRDFQPATCCSTDCPPPQQVRESPASLTGRLPPGARRISTWRTAPPTSRCCTARHGVSGSPTLMKRLAACWPRLQATGCTGECGTHWPPRKKCNWWRRHGGRQEGRT